MCLNELIITLHVGALILVLSIDVLKITLHSAAAEEILINYITFLDPGGITILFKIITRMKLLFSNYLGDYSYSFQGYSELISITVTVFPCFSCRMELQEIVSVGNSQAFLAITVT